jgi:hypothetical protein
MIRARKTRQSGAAVPADDPVDDLQQSFGGRGVPLDGTGRQHL